ncbi:MGH1-like glycoside hydrolase domain-containing protein [Streptomyces sp. NBC_00829]|uniref:MGH1-like glycoside hydrolase domain-containing protein n=1 Tax=Streptomyces sp. NBC_00829 TaxID=2903679 RepID=UPI00386DDF00|nr:trehalase family glycosidase [Streptomyces sp. NBC_00829]
MTSLANPIPFDRTGIPEPVLDSAPHLIELYWTAWAMAWDHVVERDGVARSPYMDEGFDPETIWIWDTCFMAHFCKYAPQRFPGIESLENFYQVMYDGAASPLSIQHPDNPPLFAWSEEEYARHTGDVARVARILEGGYLQKHFAFFDAVQPGSVFPYSIVPTAVERTDRGYLWNGICSGMDNTPRASELTEHGTYGDILWSDAAAQQALSARSIARLAELVGDHGLAGEFRARHAELVNLVDDFWDPEEGMYYDRASTAPFDFHRVKTPAAYWPLLAGASSTEQAAKLADALEDSAVFGGDVPWPSVARDDPAFRATGHYWRGGVWIPLAYMSGRALADTGHAATAARAARRLLDHMARTYSDYNPPTIWEAYSPNRPAPSTGKDDQYIVRPDFCGWSALAPIAMLIEHVLGFRVDAIQNEVVWTRPGGVAGIRGLWCGTTSLSVTDDGEGLLSVQTNGPLRLTVDGTAYDLTAGCHTVRTAT